MSIAFAEYLDAKYPLDERSLNRDVRALFESSLRSHSALRILDMGCGSGASLRRLLEAGLNGRVELTGVDRDADLLQLARDRIVHDLEMAEFELSRSAEVVDARRNREVVTLRLEGADLSAYEPAQSGIYDAVIAQALMDLLPLERMVERIRRWLVPAGLFYASLNYDAGTVLYPAYGDGEFEAALLGVYDASMDRWVDGQRCGGAHSGRRLHAALSDAGFDILALGSSDWNITPYCGAYRDADKVCLAALLEMIHGEGLRSGQFETRQLGDWLGDRQTQLADQKLGLIIHQIDLVAQKASA
jgi:SAM-dependent methyltransferase